MHLCYVMNYCDRLALKGLDLWHDSTNWIVRRGGGGGDKSCNLLKLKTALFAEREVQINQQCSEYWHLWFKIATARRMNFYPVTVTNELHIDNITHLQETPIVNMTLQISLQVYVTQRVQGNGVQVKFALLMSSAAFVNSKKGPYLGIQPSSLKSVNKQIHSRQHTHHCSGPKYLDVNRSLASHFSTF